MPPDDAVRSRSRMEIAGPAPRAAIVRSVTVPGLAEPFVFGVHEEFAEQYGVDMDDYETRPTTNDMFIASVGTCLAGVYALALEARGVPITAAELDAETVGDIGVPDGGGEAIVRSIHVRIRLRLPEQHHDLARRVHGFYHEGCLLTQTLRGSRCAVSSELEFDEP